MIVDKLVRLPLVQAIKSCFQSEPCTHTIEHSRSNLKEIDIYALDKHESRPTITPGRASIWRSRVAELGERGPSLKFSGFKRGLLYSMSSTEAMGEVFVNRKDGKRSVMHKYQPLRTG